MLRNRFAGTPSVSIVDGDATAMDFRREFTGAACFTMLHHVPDGRAPGSAVRRGGHRVLTPGAALVASDSLASDGLAGMHEDDTYNPVDPATLPDRLAAGGLR